MTICCSVTTACVVPLNVRLTLRAHLPGVRISHVDLPLRHQRRAIRIRAVVIAQLPSQPVNGGRTVPLVFAVRGVLVGKLLIEPAPRFDQPLATTLRDRQRFAFAARFELAPPLTQPRLTTIRRAREPITIKPKLDPLDHLLTRLHRGRALPLDPLPRRRQRSPPPLTRTQRLGQLIPARLPVALVLLTIHALSLREYLGHDRLIPPVAIPRRVRANPGAVDRNLPNPHQPSLATHRQDAHEQLADRDLVPATELRDSRVIRHRHRRDHLERHIPTARPLNLPRGPQPDRIRVQQQRAIIAGSYAARPCPFARYAPLNPSRSICSTAPSTVHTK